MISYGYTFEECRPVLSTDPCALLFLLAPYEKHSLSSLLNDWEKLVPIVSQQWSIRSIPQRWNADDEPVVVETVQSIPFAAKGNAGVGVLSAIFHARLKKQTDNKSLHLFLIYRPPVCVCGVRDGSADTTDADTWIRAYDLFSVRARVQTSRYRR